MLTLQFMRWCRARPEEAESSWQDFRDFLLEVERTEHPKTVEGPVTRRNPKTGKEFTVDEVVASLPGYVPAKLKVEGERNAKNVESVSALVLDFDDLKVEEWQGVREKLSGLSHVWHSTYSHRPISGELCYRVAIELDRPVPGAHWKPFFELMAAELGAVNDEKCKDPCRFFFAPYCPLDGPEPESGYGEGVALPVDQILAEARKPGANSKVARTQGVPLKHADIAKIIPKHYKKLDNENTVKGYEGLVAALDGRPFAQRGERHATLLYMSGILSREFPNNTPEEIAAPFLALDDDEDKIPASDALLRMLAHDLEKNALEREEFDREKLEQVGRSSADGGYTFEEIDSYWKRLRLGSREEMARYLIIANGADYYVFSEGDYIFLGSKERAENAVHGHLAMCTATLPVAVGEETKKGWEPKSLKSLYQQYGVYADTVVKDLRLQQSYYDKKTRTFHYAICRRNKELSPVFSPRCAAMINGWSDPQAVNDWAATSPRLEQSTACLFLDGDEKTGKTTFARGCAYLYGARYTPLHQLTTAFNDSLARCPIVFAEESLPWDFRRDTGMLKELITSDSQQLKKKFQDNSELIGSIRLIIAKNDHKLFEAGEVLTEATVKALSSRILYINTGHVAAPHIPPKEMAEHILWLEQNHEVSPGASTRGGMWTTGKPSRLHHRLRAFTSKVSVSVCQWLLSFIENPRMSGDTSGAQYRMDSQGLRINPRLVYEKWEAYGRYEHRQPTMAQVAEALGGISTREGSLLKVDLDVLAEYADGVVSPLGSRTALQSAIEKSGAAMARATAN